MEIKGKIIYDENEFDFSLNDDNLEIFCDIKEAAILTTFKPSSPGVYSFSGNEKLKENILEGKTDGNFKINIKVIWSYYDFFKFKIICKIHCYIVYKEEKLISGIKIKGQDVFNLFNDSYYVRKKVKSTHKFKFKDDTLGKISFSSNFNDKKHILNNFCKVMFEETNNIDNVLNKYYDVRALFKFIYHRNLIDFSSLELIDKKSKKIGELFVPGEAYVVSKSDLRRTVSFYLIQRNIGKLMTDICHNALYDLHFRDTYSSTIKLDIGKLVSLTSGIEHEFDRFNVKIKHNKKKKQQIKFVKSQYEKILSHRGIRSDGRSIVKNAIKHLDDEQLEAKIIYLLNLIPEKMINKIIEWYDEKGEKFSKISAAIDISKLRNDFAHGDTLSFFTQKTVLDLEVIEIAFTYFQFFNYLKDSNTTTRLVERLFDVRFTA